MPHIILETTSRLAPTVNETDLLQKLHDELASSSVLELTRIKTRALYTDRAIVGENTNRDFLHVTISILSGRSEEVRKNLGKNMFDRLTREVKDRIEPGTALTLEVREMQKETYFR